MSHFPYVFFHFVTLLLSSCFGSELATGSETKPATCGLIKVSKIVGGTAANDFYPWFVALVNPESANEEHYQVSCGAALITPKHVLTAGHCYSEKPNKDELLVIINLTNRCTKGGKILETANVDVHEHYDKSARIPPNDIALIYLKEEVSNMPVCLPSRGRYAGQRGMIIGYGSTLLRSSYPCQMLFSQVEIIPRKECTKRKNLKIPMVEKTICAGSLSGGFDACDGDSGGPLMAITEGSYELIGIVSYGEGCGRAGSPGIYTDVTKRGFLDWVERRLGNYKPTVSADDGKPSQPQTPTLDNSPSFSDSDYVPELPPLSPSSDNGPQSLPPRPTRPPFPPMSYNEPQSLPPRPFRPSRPPPCQGQNFPIAARPPMSQPPPPGMVIGPNGMMMDREEAMMMEQQIAQQEQERYLRRVRRMRRAAMRAFANMHRGAIFFK